MTLELVKSALMRVALFGTPASAKATKTHRLASTGTVTNDRDVRDPNVGSHRQRGVRAFAQSSDKPGIPGAGSHLQNREFHGYESARMPPIAW